MANRYWVGGTAAWDGTAGTKWSDTSGGAGGASLPTINDDVFFDSNSSTGTITISTGNTGAKNLNCTGFAGTLFAGSGVILSVNGNLTLVAGMTFSYTGGLGITAAATLITAGKALGNLTLNPGSGNTVTLGDALTIGTFNTFSITSGIFNTANYAVTAGSLQASSFSTVNLGSSTITLNGVATVGMGVNVTLNAGTSQINIAVSNTGTSLTLGNKTYYNVSFTNSARSEILMGSTGATFNNLSFVGPGSSSTQTVVLGADITVNGTLTAAGPTSVRRMFIRSSEPSVVRTITAAAVSAQDCDFESITISGAAAPISPVRAGNCGGNSGITFPTPKTVYRVGPVTGWSTNNWALSSGGTPDLANFPLAQDTAIINNDTALTGTLILSANYNAGALDCSARSTTLTLSYTGTYRWHGSHTLSSAITVSGTGTQTFAGRAAIDFTSAGKTITFGFSIANPSGTFRLMDAFNGSTTNSTITVSNGTFDANNYNVTCQAFSSNASTTRAVTMGSGLWTLTGTGLIWNTTLATNLTFNKGTADILLSSTSANSRTFSSGNLSLNKLTIGGATGTSTTALSYGGSASFAEIASTKTVAHTITLSSPALTLGTWSVTGTTGNIVTFNSSPTGNRRNFTLTNITNGINYLAVQDIGELSGNKFYVGANSVNNGNNSNVYFTDPPSTAATGNMLMLF